MSQTLPQALAVFQPTLPLAVALSGGADSCALLVACAQKWPGQVRAIHVHHGLQAAADQFEQHCQALCDQLDVPLVVQRVDARHAKGDSPENAARQARYQALTQAVSLHWPQDPVLDIAIAQHADDQVETLLLALTRGAGLPGLAAMPARWQRGATTFHRPLLGVPGHQVRDWLRAQGHTWVEDPSNANQQFTRNRIRARLLPALEAAFPQFRETFARSCAHAAQAQGVLTDVAIQDLTLVVGTGKSPSIKALQTLSHPRQANVLRHWLRTVHGCTPSTAQLAELLDQIAACTTRGHQLRLKVGTGFVRRQGDCMDWSGN